MRAPIVIAGSLLALIAAGVLLERSAWFAPIRRVARDRDAPAEALDVGPAGRILRGEGLVHSAQPHRDDRWRGQGKRSVFRAHPGGVPSLPSDRGVARHLVEGWPLISIAVDEADLHDPERGIVTNWQTDWERPANVSLFLGEELRFATRCGIRLQGGTSRNPEKQAQRGADWRSYRLYFREEYGATAVPPGLLFSAIADPLDRLIVRGNSPLNSAFAFEISRRLGAPAPEMRPGLFVLNGELQGLFSLSEHVSKRNWARRLGHEEFHFYRLRGENEKDDQAAFVRLKRWSRELPAGDFTMAAVGERVDVDKLSRHLFATMWCGVYDWMQGAAVLDRTDPEPRWWWVHWDMDNAFQDSDPRDYGPVWKKPSIGLILERHGAVRGTLFQGLVRDDPAFGAFFLRLATELMNHRLTPAFFQERMAFFRRYRGGSGLSARALKRQEEFNRNRSAVVRRQLDEVFGCGAALACEVVAPAGAKLVVDGYPAGARYAGWYFPGQRVRVRLAEGGPAIAWIVNGERVGGAELSLRARETVRIAPLLRSEAER